MLSFNEYLSSIYIHLSSINHLLFTDLSLFLYIYLSIYLPPIVKNTIRLGYYVHFEDGVMKWRIYALKISLCRLWHLKKEKESESQKEVSDCSQMKQAGSWGETSREEGEWTDHVHFRESNTFGIFIIYLVMYSIKSFFF